MAPDFIEPSSLSFSFKVTDEDWKKICSELDNVEHCNFCKYHNNCHGISCYGGEPIEPPCAYQTVTEYIDNKKFYEMYIKGMWKNEEENEMRNEVLELWFRRKGNDIEKKYDELESKYIDEKYSVVKSYEDMIEDFERQLEDLYKYDNANEQFVLKENNGCNVFKYVLDEDKLVEEAEQFYKEDKNKEMQDVLNEYNEIDALLSMSEDLEYQQSILIEYGIIDKKTKRMI